MSEGHFVFLGLRNIEDGLFAGESNLLDGDVARLEFHGLQHSRFFALAGNVQHPIVAAVGRLSGEALATNILLLGPLAVRGIDPSYVVPVMFERHFNRARLLDINDVLDAFERDAASTIDAEEWLEFPVAIARHELGPRGHVRAGA